jgi:transcriptional regulator with XRE-family HTH domain
MNIGTAIRTLRLKESLLQEEFASRIGITQTYLSQIERGHKNPSLDVLNSMAKDLKLPLPLMFWFGVEESDIQENKKEAYKTLKPSIDALIGSLF